MCAILPHCRRRSCSSECDSSPLAQWENLSLILRQRCARSALTSLLIHLALYVILKFNKNKKGGVQVLVQTVTQGSEAELGGGKGGNALPKLEVCPPPKKKLESVIAPPRS